MLKRDLTKSEQKVVGFLRSYYNLVDARKLTGVLYISSEALEILAERNITKWIKAEWDKKENLYSVTFALWHLKDYIDYCVLNLGMKIDVHGTVILYDGYKVSLYK